MSSYMKAISLVSVILSFVVLTGCATILSGSKQPLNVRSNVEGADVYVNGELVGKTPFSGTVKKQKSMHIRVSKAGYQQEEMILKGSVESVFWLNILVGGLLGSTTDLATGSMWQVSPNTYNVDLKPVGE